MRAPLLALGLTCVSLVPALAAAQSVAPAPSVPASSELPPAPSLEDHLSVAGGLRVGDVVQAVVDTSHDRAARLAEVSAARTEIDRAGYGFVPRLGVSVGYTRLSEIEAPVLGVLAAPADQRQRGLLPSGAPLVAVPLAFPVILDQTQVRAQLVIPVTDYFLRVLPARDAAEHGASAGEALVEVSEQRLALEAETLYWGWARASLGIVVAEQALAAARAHRDDAERLAGAGIAVATDLARAEAQVAAMEELVATTTHARDAAADRLRTVMHVERIPSGVGEALASVDDEVALEQAVELALARRPELRALDEQLAALEAQRTLQTAGMIPRVDVVGEALLANPNPRYVPQTERFDFTWAVGAQASWQLADALSAEASGRALEARIGTVREQRDLAREGLRAEVVDAHRAILDARVSRSSREAQVRAAERTLELAGALYRAGRGTSLVVIDAQTLLVRARLDLLAARIDGQVARARLRRATGE
jgi:outer membrane protein TolC